jgi:hypothetical protein
MKVAFVDFRDLKINTSLRVFFEENSLAKYMN